MPNEMKLVEFLVLTKLKQLHFVYLYTSLIGKFI